MLNTALLLTWHGYETMNVENVKSCIRLFLTSRDSVRNQVIVGVLLRSVTRTFSISVQF